MIKQAAIVTSISDDIIHVDAKRQSTCSACAAKNACGSGLLEKHVGQRFSQIAIKRTECQQDMEVGQAVQLEIPESSLLQGAFLMYMMPLFMMMAFAVTVNLLGFSDNAEIFAGLAGLFAGFLITRQIFKSKHIGIDAKVVEAD